MENDSHDTQKDVQGAKVIDFTYHYNRRVAEKMTRQIGKAALGRPSYDIKRPFSGRLAPVYDISVASQKLQLQKPPLKKTSLLGSKIPKGKSLQK